MTEPTTPEKTKTSIGSSFKKDNGISSSFSEVRQEYSAHRNEVKKDLIEAGANPDTNAFRKILRKFARRNTEKDRESMTDELTGLYNTRGFNKRFDEEVKRQETFGGNMVIVRIDVNELKPLNDKEGHLAGDERIQDIANLLKAGSRTTDIIGRVGGDEFAVAPTGTDLEGALKWAQKNVRNLNNAKVYASMGSSLVDTNKPQLSIQKADDESYKMKELARKTNGTYYSDGLQRVA